MPGGVNSPVRAFKAVGGTPPFIRSAKGAWLEDEDGHRYVDYVGSWGPMILGHAHPAVVEAATEAVQQGASFGAPTRAEVELAERLAELVPSMEMSRLVSSGTEAVMGAVRAARGFTGRDQVIKFEGGYHGGADYLLVKAGSGAATLGVPDSAGIPAAIAGTCTVLPYNDLNAVKQTLQSIGDTVAAILVEPVAGNMGCIPPAEGFLQGLRKLCTTHGVVLIFDEVMTGFRVALGGAQARYNVTPDLTTLGKIVGGGFPLAAYGGRRDIMERVAPSGPVYQAGTLSGNPVAVAAGLATLEQLTKDESTYAQLEATSAQLATMAREAAAAAGVPVTVQQVGAMLTVFFTEQSAVTNWNDSAACNADQFRTWHATLLEHGIYWPPSPFEAAFPSLAHGEPELTQTQTALTAAFEAVANMP